MATGKVKKMALGGMGGMGGISKVSNAKPGLTPAAQKAQFQRAGTTFGKPGGSQSQIPAFARPYVDKTMSAARTQSPMQNAAKQAGKVGASMARSMMKKGGAVKKKATKK